MRGRREFSQKARSLVVETSDKFAVASTMGMILLEEGMKRNIDVLDFVDAPFGLPGKVIRWYDDQGIVRDVMFIISIVEPSIVLVRYTAWVGETIRARISTSARICELEMPVDQTKFREAIARAIDEVVALHLVWQP